MQQFISAIDASFTCLSSSQIFEMRNEFKWGFFAGIASVLWLFFMNMNRLSLNDDVWYLEFVTTIFLAIGIYMAILKKRDELGGAISFKQAMQAGLIATFVVALLSGIFSFLYFKYSDPDYTAKLAQHFVDAYKARLGRGLTPEEEKNLLSNATAEYSAAGKMMSEVGTDMFEGLFITLVVAGLLNRKRENIQRND